MSNDIIHWIKFFLTSVIETASKGKVTFQGVLELRQYTDSLVLGYGKRAENTQKLLQRLYSRPATNVTDTATLLGVSHQAASGLIKKLVEDNGSQSFQIT